MEGTILRSLITEGTPYLILFIRSKSLSQSALWPVYRRLSGGRDHWGPFQGLPATRTPKLGPKGTSGTSSAKSGTKAQEEHSALLERREQGYHVRSRPKGINNPLPANSLSAYVSLLTYVVFLTLFIGRLFPSGGRIIVSTLHL